ncbi:MAG: M23 family metallopeptidase [Prevotella sp.]|nr:M23 family metallopeptidase [Prevotella sp.]MCM1074419.1 M23 family metallopeptidase [Ruminococcus sp.]
MKLRRYRLILEDASRLNKVVAIRISRLRLVITCVCVCALCMGIGVMFVYLSPVKRQMPGYMSGTERREAGEAIARLDTLSLVVASNQVYLNNVLKLLDTEREPTDSAHASVRLAPLPLDSLKTASPAEREFVAQMSEREKYNLNVLTPVAADAVIFEDPSAGGIIVGDSGKSQMLKIIIPYGEGVNAIADGYVIDRTYDAAEGTFSLLIQSKRGFLTRYSRLGSPLVDKGDAIQAGQRITPAPASVSPRNNYIAIEMWREGTPLIPGDYLMHRNRTAPKDDIADPRGK